MAVGQAEREMAETRDEAIEDEDEDEDEKGLYNTYS